MPQPSAPQPAKNWNVLPGLKVPLGTVLKAFQRVEVIDRALNDMTASDPKRKKLLLRRNQEQRLYRRLAALYKERNS